MHQIYIVIFKHWKKYNIKWHIQATVVFPELNWLNVHNRSLKFMHLILNLYLTI